MHTYSDCSTQLKYKNGVSPSIASHIVDVKQGDPMSPALFNSIIDYDRLIICQVVLIYKEIVQ